MVFIGFYIHILRDNKKLLTLNKLKTFLMSTYIFWTSSLRKRDQNTVVSLERQTHVLKNRALRTLTKHNLHRKKLYFSEIHLLTIWHLLLTIIIIKWLTWFRTFINNWVSPSCTKNKVNDNITGTLSHGNKVISTKIVQCKIDGQTKYSNRITLQLHLTIPQPFCYQHSTHYLTSQLRLRHC